MNLVRRLLILIIIISGFVFAVSFATLYAQTYIVEGTACACTLPIPLLIPTFSSLGIIVGLTVYLFASKTPEEVEKIDKETFLNLFEDEERVVVSKILENGGEILQSKLSKEIGKVKTFRIVERLKRRGVLDKVKYGKTNKIILTEKLKKLLI
ncbi:MAG: hypothetical protein J7L39_00795 [Candidatus Aenigmarchaeota archaeon]|nr:hypothetical protein [Candidatus Aenigmarchaeota archaeon]